MTLPDIDTTQVSFIGYWNAITQGGADSDNWDASEVLSYGPVTSSTSYDNGVDGTLSFSNGRTANFRAKQDGWLIVWLDRAQNEATDSQSVLRGPWDVIRNWGGSYSSNSDNAQVGTLNDNEIENALNGLFNNTSVSSDINVTFTDSEVGYYNYWNEGTNVTLLSDQIRQGSTSESDYAFTNAADMSYTDTTTVPWHACFTAIHQSNSGINWYQSRSSVGGTNSTKTVLADTGNLNVDRQDNVGWVFGARLASNINYAQNSGTSYDQTIVQGEGSDRVPGCNLHQLLVWS